ncbi:MAG: hypothetical protein E7324_08435 [Clostridiales bacterium]|nr:hypothetical protein [Clostridiales bacterium]
MQDLLGLPLAEALRRLPEGHAAPRVTETAASARNGQARGEGTLRIIAVRENEWIAARFMDAAPKEQEEA